MISMFLCCSVCLNLCPMVCLNLCCAVVDLPFILRVCCYSGLVFQVVNTILVMHDKPCTMLDAYGGA